MQIKKRNFRNAFSLLELLIALIILSILTLMLMPVLKNRTEKAREARAVADINAIKRALSNVEIDTGYYVRLPVLNDTTNRVDEENDISTAGEIYGNYVIDEKTGDYVEYNENGTGDLSFETMYTWIGPYITYQNLQDTNGDQIPEDPWGMPYMLFTQLGLVEESPYDALNLGEGTPGNYTNSIISEDDKYAVFDSITVLSTGKNRALGKGEGNSSYAEIGSDDIYVSF